MNTSYLCQDFGGRWFLASENLTAALDRESVRSPVNVADARLIEVGQVWVSPDTGNRFRITGLLPDSCTDGRVQLERIAPERDWEEGTHYTWHPASLSAMRHEVVIVP